MAGVFAITGTKNSILTHIHESSSNSRNHGRIDQQTMVAILGTQEGHDGWLGTLTRDLSCAVYPGIHKSLDYI